MTAGARATRVAFVLRDQNGIKLTVRHHFVAGLADTGFDVAVVYGGTTSAGSRYPNAREDSLTVCVQAVSIAFTVL